MNVQVMIYEVKSAAAANAKVLFSDDNKYFYWNEVKFKNLELGDFVFVVNKTDKWILFTKLDKQNIQTQSKGSDTIFRDNGQEFNVAGIWQGFIRLNVLNKLDIPKDWEWKSLGSSENTYLHGERISTNSANNRLLNIQQISQLTDDELILKVLKASKRNFEHIPSEPSQFKKEPKQKQNDANMKNIINLIEKYISTKGFTFNREEIANFYLSLKTKPFVILAGISGTGKTQLPRLFGEAVGMTKEQVIQIPVRPDWTDASDLIGYTSLNGKFISKPLTDAILKAKKQKDQPYFFILDEMNLARVEHYFADFLSIIETREKSAQNEIITDSIITESQIKDAKNKETYENLDWPDNLYLIGTVNMDETTHPFSRKVLDRANSIEMNTVELDWITPETKEIQPLDTFTNQHLRSSFVGSIDLTEKDKASVKKALEFLKEINDILKIADLHFAYRVRDEIVFYLLYAKKENLLSDKESLDFQLKQKVLPRIHGSSIRTQKVLVMLINKLTDESLSPENPDMSFLQSKKSDLIKKSDYPRSLEKLFFMLERFDEDRFTSFWV